MPQGRPKSVPVQLLLLTCCLCDGCFTSSDALRLRDYLVARIVSFAAEMMASGVKPYFFCNSFSGAEAPKVFIPIRRPDGPTYCPQPNVEACSIETRA